MIISLDAEKNAAYLHDKHPGETRNARDMCNKGNTRACISLNRNSNTFYQNQGQDKDIHSLHIYSI